MCIYCSLVILNDELIMLCCTFIKIRQNGLYKLLETLQTSEIMLFSVQAYTFLTWKETIVCASVL